MFLIEVGVVGFKGFVRGHVAIFFAIIGFLRNLFTGTLFFAIELLLELDQMFQTKPSEFNPSLEGSIAVEPLSERVVFHKFFEFRGFQAHKKVPFRARSETDLRLQVEQNLVITEVRQGRKSQESQILLSSILDTLNMILFSLNYNNTFLNHIELIHHVSGHYNSFIRDKLSRVKIGEEVRDEFLTSFKAKVIILKHIIEVVLELVKEFFDHLVSNAWL